MPLWCGSNRYIYDTQMFVITCRHYPIFQNPPTLGLETKLSSLKESAIRTHAQCIDTNIPVSYFNQGGNSDFEFVISYAESCIICIHKYANNNYT